LKVGHGEHLDESPDKKNEEDGIDEKQ